MTEPSSPRPLPLDRWHRALFIAGAALALVPAIVHAYVLMPFPGSQDLEAMVVAYYLEKALAPLLVLGLLLLALPVAHVVLRGSLGRRIGLGLFAALGAAVAFATTSAFSAEKMFREPSTLAFLTADRSAIPLDAVVLGVAQGGAARAYPIDLMGYHHKVLDDVGGRPVLVTYCTMCRTGRVYSPVVDGSPQRFRLVGARHYNAILEDQETGSWWYQGSGRAAVGPRAGKQLEVVESSQTTLRSWLAAHPNSTILQPDPAFTGDYVGFAGYDRRRPAAEAGADPRWSRRSWVIGVEVDGAAKAYPWDDLVSRRVTNDSVGSALIVIAIEEDGASFHVLRRDVDGQALELAAAPDGKGMVDAQSGSIWSLEGVCLSGKYAGRKLAAAQGYQEYWHSWKTFHPATERWSPAP